MASFNCITILCITILASRLMTASSSSSPIVNRSGSMSIQGSPSASLIVSTTTIPTNGAIITLPQIATLPSSIESLMSLRRTTILITLRVQVVMWIIQTASSSKILIPGKLISSTSVSVEISLIVALNFVRSFVCFFQNTHVVHKLIQREGSVSYALMLTAN